MKKINSTELINGLILIILGGWIWWYSSGFPLLEQDYPGPALFPRIIAVGFIFCGIILLATMTKNPKALSSVAGRSLLILLGGAGLVALFPFLQQYIEFVVALGIICFCFGLLLKVKWWKAAITATVTSLFIYLVFVMILGVSL